MQIVRYTTESGEQRVGVSQNGATHRANVSTVDDLLRLSLSDIREVLTEASLTGPDTVRDFLSPIDGRTEVWASGVTYLRSRDARIEESRDRDVYERVYDAERPELFFKSAAWRTVTTGQPIGIRDDSVSNVPEPELGVVVNSRGEIVGYLVCNDVSSRSIEGENPLYLPQAKIYAGACALSPGIRPSWELDPSNLGIRLSVERKSIVVYEGSTTTAQLKRSISELVDYLFRAESFPCGAVLSTGTGIVPSLDFTLEPSDIVAIEIDGVGSLINSVVRGKTHFDGVVR